MRIYGGPFFSLSFSLFRLKRGLRGKSGITKKNIEKPSIYADLHEVFSALKAFLVSGGF